MFIVIVINRAFIPIISFDSHYNSMFIYQCYTHWPFRITPCEIQTTTCSPNHLPYAIGFLNRFRYVLVFITASFAHSHHWMQMYTFKVAWITTNTQHRTKLLGILIKTSMNCYDDELSIFNHIRTAWYYGMGCKHYWVSHFISFSYHTLYSMWNSWIMSVYIELHKVVQVLTIEVFHEEI